MTGSFTDSLVAAEASRWRAATEHRFVRALADDTLDDAVFRRYLVQDFAFIESLVTLLGLAVARAPTMAAKRRFAGFLAAVTGDETNYFERALTALGAADAFAAPERIAVAPATARFRHVMEEVGAGGDYADILAVLVPAEGVYLAWASACPPQRPRRFYLAEWIDLHALPAFADFVGWMRRELDAAAAMSPRRAELAARFRTVLDLECAFFDMAYDAA
ncbi:MAG: TenA family protein [Rhodospirillaceae bacterium]|nr:TenA family protein [Rhodospirillaceae bacterium]